MQRDLTLAARLVLVALAVRVAGYAGARLAGSVAGGNVEATSGEAMTTNPLIDE